MKSVLFVCLVASFCLGTASAQDLGNSRELPVKNTPSITYEPPAVPKQGGDTIADATVILGLPYSNSGTTAGFNNDYDEACPYTGSTAPDVVYSFTPDDNVQLDVDLCGSSYDTKVYIYDADLNRIACNDDAYFDDVCGTYVSKIENATLFGGNAYHIVVDGYGGEFGDYIIDVEGYDPCIFAGCPDDAVPEGEPPLHDGYEDAYNGGCNSPEFDYPFQAIDWTNDADGVPPYDGSAWLCGKSGWYVGSEGYDHRDTDWFKVFAYESGMMEFTVESEYPCRIVSINSRVCDLAIAYPQALADCGAPGTLIFPVYAGQEVWLVVLPTTFSGPVTEFSYFMTVSNNMFDTVPDKGVSWGAVKALYR